MKHRKTPIAAALLLLLLGTAFYARIPPAELHSVETTPARVERGEYLANHVAGCVDCHSRREWAYFAHPHEPGTEGAGGEYFDLPVGPVYSPNITPATLGSWSDGEIYRAITSGVSRDGRLLNSQMPYPEYRLAATEDIYALIAYLRTLAPISNEVPVSRLRLPFTLYHRMTYRPAEPQAIPASRDEVAYGAYLVNLAGCQYCHTPKKWMQPIDGMEFAGGYEHSVPGGKVFSANITPHPGTGIGAWSRDVFIQRFKSYSAPEAGRVVVPPNGMKTVMPWISYSGMTEADLGAIYEYLMSQKPIENPVLRFVPSPPTD